MALRFIIFLLSFLIANRNDPSDFIEPLTMKHTLRLDGNFIFFFNDIASIQGLWCHHLEDSKRVYNLLNKLVDKLKASSTEQARAAAAAAKASAPVPINAPPTTSSATPTLNSKSVNLLQMIKVAQQSSNPQQVHQITPTSVQLPSNTPFLTNLIGPEKSEARDAPSSSSKPSNSQAPPVSTMPVLLQKLMVQEQPRSMLKEPGTAMSADELEKDLLKSANPRHQLLQDFVNSPSAISLAAVSTKSIHGSEGDGDCDITEGEILEPLETSFVVGSGTTTPVLNKEQVRHQILLQFVFFLQFISAIAHLMRTDDEFVTQIHQAYVDALNRRLNLD